MAVPTSEPGRWDWTLIPGDTAQPASFVLEDEDGTAYDLTGVTGVCEIRTDPGSVLLLSPTVTITSAAAGTFTFVAAPSLTDDLGTGRARYGVRLTWPTGEVRTVVEGVVTVRAGVVS